MPKVHHVKKARKDYPKQGIKRGSPYWWFSSKRNGRFTGKVKFAKPPRRSQLTGSEYLGDLYREQETLEDAAAEFSNGFPDVPDEDDADFSDGDWRGAALERLGAFEDACEAAAEAVRELAERTREKFDNMPEQLKASSNAELLNTRAEACEQLADALAALHGEVGAADVEELTAEFAAEKLAEIDWSEAEQ